MNRNLCCGLVITLLLISSAYAVKVGEPAPDFQATDSNGQVHKLSNERGEFVVLEWHNNGCPYTQKHYESGNMQRLQKEWTGKGVVWFTVISSAQGQQGDRKSTRLNSSHSQISYAVFCLKKKTYYNVSGA